MTATKQHAVVVGGGFAGLAAAVRLANAGVRVTLLERRPFLGGRAYSFEHPATGETLDNGPHALMAFECGRARAYYLRASASLAPEDRSSLAAAEAMRLIYMRLLNRIEARHFDVFGPKVTVPRYEKVTLALAAWGRSQLAALSL